MARSAMDKLTIRTFCDTYIRVLKIDCRGIEWGQISMPQKIKGVSLDKSSRIQCR